MFSEEGVPFEWEEASKRTIHRFNNIRLIEKTPDDFDKPLFPMMFYPSRGKFDHERVEGNALNNLSEKKKHFHKKCTICENRMAFQMARRIVLSVIAFFVAVWLLTTFVGSAAIGFISLVVIFGSVAAATLFMFWQFCRMMV